MRRDGRTMVWPQEPGKAGASSKENAHANGSITLRPGDAVMLYTNGVLQAANSDGEAFGEERLVERLDRCREQSSSELVADIVKALESHKKGHQQSDDIALLAIRRVE